MEKCRRLYENIFTINHNRSNKNDLDMLFIWWCSSAKVFWLSLWTELPSLIIYNWRKAMLEESETNNMTNKKTSFFGWIVELLSFFLKMIKMENNKVETKSPSQTALVCKYKMETRISNKLILKDCFQYFVLSRFP